MSTDNVDVLIELGTVLGLTDNLDKAKKYFGHALKLDEKNITVNTRLGKLLIRTGDMDLA